MNSFMEQMQQSVEREKAGAYKAFYAGLEELEYRHLPVVKRQAENYFESAAIEYAIANLLFAASTASQYPKAPSFTRKDFLQSVKAYLSIPHGHAAIISLVLSNFPQALFCAEHMFFQNREISRLVDLPHSERPPWLVNAVKEDWVIPMEEIESLRALALDLWQAEKKAS